MSCPIWVIESSKVAITGMVSSVVAGGLEFSNQILFQMLIIIEVCFLPHCFLQSISSICLDIAVTIYLGVYYGFYFLQETRNEMNFHVKKETGRKKL